jgi:uncharacterized protein YjbI with pentapeptide repeats
VTIRKVMRWFQRSSLRWAILALLIVAVLWIVPKIQVPQEKVTGEKRLALVNEYRRTWAQILGGAALLSGVYFTWRTLQVNREGQITERFTRAIDQLGEADDKGAPRLEIRLGGIYALERIAGDSPERDYSTVMEVLTAYVRQNAPLPQSKTMKPSTLPITDLINQALLNVRERLSEKTMKSSTPSEEQDAEATSPVPRTDIQAILTVLGRTKQRVKNQVPEELDLRQTDLQGTHLLGNLQEADLRGTNLQGANLQGAKPRGAKLQSADLQEANLQEARLKARLRGADLQQANLQGASLQGANLQRANLRGADLQQVEKGTLDQEQINLAYGDERTTLPESLQRPQAWGNSLDDQTDGD